MIGIIVLAVVGVVLLFPVVMTLLAKRKLAQLDRAKATIAGHEARLAAEGRAKNTIVDLRVAAVQGAVAEAKKKA
ncbi:hypothetical protein ACIGXI_02225 [Kitasatospora aureofaciens]|uniref:hypothetical protein n=1 Tax=Kitasatospora aureofaciens TaxID=1894 RepID=UPI0037C75FE7